MASSVGFTLVELVVVTGIIGILATMALPTYDTFITRARNARAKSEVRLLETEINAYRFDTNSLPASLAVINRAGMLDPWDRPYVYIIPPIRERFGNRLNNDYDLCSLGKDGLTPADGAITGTGEDDLIRGNNGVFVGSGEDY